jgi:hypothetical protein
MNRFPGRLLLYARTASHLQPRQILYWPLRRLQHRLPFRLRDAGTVEEAPHAEALAEEVVAWGAGAAAERLARARAVVEGDFEFLNHTLRLDPPDWRARYESELWTMNLHYFDYAVDLAWAYRITREALFLRRLEALADAWIRFAPPVPGDRGGEAWEPYSISKRVVNWSTALLLVGSAMVPAARRRILSSLHTQADLLSRRLEHHIQANHLQANYRGLLFAGLLLAGHGPRTWRRTGERGTWAEAQEQVLADGCHYERSPLYHMLSLSDFLECAALVRAAGGTVPDDVTETLRRMARAAGVLSRPNGTLHLFNDSANGIAPPLSVVSALAERVSGEPVAHPDGALALVEGGYYAFVRHAAGERMVVDCGEPGPKHQPGHAHCDVLSYELDLGGRPVVVDSGVRGYVGDPLRAYVRSTRAHNTVEIGGLEQSEVWSTFRLARRAHIRETRFDPAASRLEGAYSPYHDAGAVHRRVVERVDGGWQVTDRVEGAQGALLRSFVHLHPDFEALADGLTVRGRAGSDGVVIETFGADSLRVVRGDRNPDQGWYSPEFGAAFPAPVVELSVAANRGEPFGYVVRGGSA